MSITITEVNLLNKEIDAANLMHGSEGVYYTINEKSERRIYDEIKFDQTSSVNNQKHYLN